jgi:hypothetical protein
MELIGKRIMMIEMKKEPHPVPRGTMGTIKLIDGIGQIHVNWDNGSSLAVQPEHDEYQIIEELPTNNFLVFSGNV